MILHYVLNEKSDIFSIKKYGNRYKDTNHKNKANRGLKKKHVQLIWFPLLKN